MITIGKILDKIFNANLENIINTTTNDFAYRYVRGELLPKYELTNIQQYNKVDLTNINVNDIYKNIYKLLKKNKYLTLYNYAEDVMVKDVPDKKTYKLMSTYAGDNPVDLYLECDMKLINLLIDNGANVNLKDKDGNTPLTIAIINSNKDVVEFLLNQNTSVKRFLIFIFSLIVIAASAQDKAKSNEFYNKAMTQFRLSHPQEAIKLLNEALSYDSLNYNAYIKRGFVKGSIGNYEGELADYNTVLNYDSAHVQAYLSRGSAYSKLKKYDLAMNDFNKVIKFDASNYEAYNNRGFVKKALGDFDGACSDWNYSKKMGNEEAIIILKNNHCKK
jgi:tetratricopeptide (TPR) repeat protein